MAQTASTHPVAAQLSSVTSGVVTPLPPKYSMLRSSATPAPCGTIALSVV